MNKQKNTTTVLHRLVFLKSITAGFCGGIIWSALFLFMHSFKMTEVDPLFLLKIIFDDSSWLSNWYAYFVLIIAYGILSIFVAMIYYFLFRQKKNWIVGGVYGAILWIIIYFILPVILINLNPFLHFEVQTHIGIFCLLLLYGVFIGYTISYDYESLQFELEK